MDPVRMNQVGRTRKGFLGGAAAVGAGLAAAPLAGVFDVYAAEAAGDDAAAILGLVATTEALAVTFYYTVLTEAKFHVDDASLISLRRALGAELHHLQMLRDLGGVPVGRPFYLPKRILSDAGTFVRNGLQLEAAFVGAYTGATYQFAQLGRPSLAAAMAQLGANEAQHLAMIGHLAGLGLDEVALPKQAFTKAADALSEVKPFLAGGAGMMGPLTFPA